MPSIDVPRAALRVSEACSALAISRSKLYLELAAGRLRAVKCGRRTLIPVPRWRRAERNRALSAAVKTC
jgi:excisionase family DNA binding protein